MSNFVSSFTHIKAYLQFKINYVNRSVRFGPTQIRFSAEEFDASRKILPDAPELGCVRCGGAVFAQECLQAS